MTFSDFARAAGVEIRDLSTDGRIHRCPSVDHPRSDNGSYLWDGRRGWVMAWDRDQECQWFDDPEAPPMSEAEKTGRAADHAKRMREVDQRHAKAALMAQEILAGCELREHTYLKIKGHPAVKGLVTTEGHLMVPMHGLAGNLVGLQRIFWQESGIDAKSGEPIAAGWKKKMSAGMDGRRAIHLLGPRQVRETWLVEGYATGLSVRAALNRMQLSAAVLVCFSTGGLVAVSEVINGTVYVAADHDKEKGGRRAGEEAAIKTGRPYMLPRCEGNDWNDEHVLNGLSGICDSIREVRGRAV